MRTRLQKLQLELPLTLERIRRQILAEISRIESFVTPSSEPLLRREQFRLRQIDHVITTRASEVVSRLQNLQADYLEKGWLDEANTIAARIREIEAGAADCVAAHDQAEQADTPMLRLVQNDAATVRWSNGDYAETAKAAGGVLVIRREAA